MSIDKSVTAVSRSPVLAVHAENGARHVQHCSFMLIRERVVDCGDFFSY